MQRQGRDLRDSGALRWGGKRGTLGLTAVVAISETLEFESYCGNCGGKRGCFSQQTDTQ